ncbi:hypothetical protein PMIN01_07857 [Paraphaeosphaeria minitans]|uniref:Uncharacterized protein n=1 Tax=Paraphaeosphaeria minitans TaxID=565426 RepID=A0A9P6GDN5_9PLEO|nr:hypothetical protein PMIN01_07857 [Paraphaeosphaeria minitans]
MLSRSPLLVLSRSPLLVLSRSPLLVLSRSPLLVVALIQPRRYREERLCNAIQNIPARTPVAALGRLHRRLDAQARAALVFSTAMHSLDSHAPHGTAKVVPQPAVLVQRLQEHHVRLLTMYAREHDGCRHALEAFDEDGIPAPFQAVSRPVVDGEPVRLAKPRLVSVELAMQVPRRVAPPQHGRGFAARLGLVVGHAAGHGRRVEQGLRGRQRNVDDGGAVGGAQGVAQDVADDPGVLARKVGKGEGAFLPAQVVERARRRRECVEHRTNQQGQKGRLKYATNDNKGRLDYATNAKALPTYIDASGITPGLLYILTYIPTTTPAANAERNVVLSQAAALHGAVRLVAAASYAAVALPYLDVPVPYLDTYLPYLPTLPTYPTYLPYASVRVSSRAATLTDGPASAPQSSPPTTPHSRPRPRYLVASAPRFEISARATKRRCAFRPVFRR